MYWFMTVTGTGDREAMNHWPSTPLTDTTPDHPTPPPASFVLVENDTCDLELDLRLSPDVDVRDKGGRAETPISFDLDALARVGCGQSDASEVQPLLFSFTIVLAPLTRIACISAKEFAAMASHALVATQISSLFPSAHALSLIVQTRRTDIPLPDESDSEHASYSNIFYAPSTGTILLRVIHGGHIVELISLSSDSPPLRFVYPSPVLPHPSLLLDGDDLHLMAVTRSGSLFCIIILLHENGSLWHAGSLSNFVVRERVVARIKGSVSPQLAHVQGLQTVVIGLSDGSLVVLEAEHVTSENDDGAYQTRVAWVWS